jgi:polyphosphate kinase 2 (PPK2 family)
MNYSKRFVVELGAKVKLHKIDPGYIDTDMTEQDALAETKKLCKRLRKLQAALYSEKQRSVLIVLQALDTGGKDSVINHVFGTAWASSASSTTAVTNRSSDCGTTSANRASELGILL